MKINGLIEHPRWYDIKCRCSTVEGDVENQYPISECSHCKFQEQEDSMPREDFVIKQNDYDENNNLTGQHDKKITEITIDRGDKHQEIRGRTF